jgi:hypothetical protein
MGTPGIHVKILPWYLVPEMHEMSSSNAAPSMVEMKDMGEGEYGKVRASSVSIALDATVSPESASEESKTSATDAVSGDLRDDLVWKEQLFELMLLPLWLFLLVLDFASVDVVKRVWDWPGPKYVGRPLWTASLLALVVAGIGVFHLGNGAERMRHAGPRGRYWFFVPAVLITTPVYEWISTYVDGASLDANIPDWKRSMLIASIFVFGAIVCTIVYHMVATWRRRSRTFFWFFCASILGTGLFLVIVDQIVQNTVGSGSDNRGPNKDGSTPYFHVVDRDCQFSLDYVINKLDFIDLSVCRQGSTANVLMPRSFLEANICTSKEEILDDLLSFYRPYVREQEREISFHLHHYAWATATACVFRLRNDRVSAMAQAIMLGLAVQGYAFYGIAHWWQYDFQFRPY